MLSARLAGWLAGSVALVLASASDAQTVYAQTQHEVSQPGQLGQQESTAAPAKPNSFGDGKSEKSGGPALRVYQSSSACVVAVAVRPPQGTRNAAVTYTWFAFNLASSVDWQSLKVNHHANNNSLDSAARQNEVDPA